MKFKIYWGILFGLMWLASIPASAQKTSIKGKIYDADTRQTLSDVYITDLDDPTVHTVSDPEGRYELPVVAKGELSFSLVGYKDRVVHYDNVQGQQDVYLTPDEVSLSTVVVKSFNSNKQNKETPGAVAVLSQQQLNQGSGVSLQTAMSSVPGVKMDQSNLGDSRISIRGNGIRSPWGLRKTKVYINDIPLTETDGTTRIEALDVSDLGRVEIIRGPASSVYGGNSTGGVINFELQRADYGTRTWEADGLVGSYGLRRIGTKVKTGSDKMNSFLAYGYQEYDGYRQNSWDYRRFLAGNFQFYPSEKQTLTLLVSRTSQDSRIPGMLTREQVKENRRQAAPNELANKAGRYQRWTRVGLGQQYRFNSHWSNSTSVFTYFYDLHHPLTFGIIRNAYQSYGGRSHFTYRPGFATLDTKFVVGGEFNQAKTKGNTYFTDKGVENGLMSNVDYKNTYYTFFYQSETKLTPEATITLGMSYNDLKYAVNDFLNPEQGGIKKFDDQFSPRLALSYDFGEHLSLHAGVSKGFAAPTTTEISNPDGTLNHGVGAEKAVNYEIDAKGSFLDARLEYDLALYRMDMKGELIGQSLGQGVTVYHNSGKTRHKGVELATGYQIFKESDGRFFTSLRPYAAVTYSQFKFEEYEILDQHSQTQSDFKGNELAGIAPWMAYFGVDLETRVGFYLNANYRYNDAFALNDANTDYNPAYHLLNARVGYKMKIGSRFSLDLYGGLNNITNEKYSSFTALNAPDYGNGPAYYDPSPGINGYAGVNLSYHF